MQARAIVGGGGEGRVPRGREGVAHSLARFMAYGYCQKAVMWATGVKRNEDLDEGRAFGKC